MNAAEQFRDAIRAAGLNPPDSIVDDGKLHRFAPNGKPRDDSAWYVLHGDGIPAGAFGDWRQDFSTTWHADIGRQLTPAEDAAHRERIKAAQAAREAEETKRRAAAARKAAELWKAASPAGADHPYLQRKGVAPAATLRELDAERAAEILGYAPQARGEALAGRLLVAPVKIGDALSTCELIDDAGRKSAIAGGAKRAGYWAAQALPEGDGSGATLLIGEGVATALSAAAATGHPAIAALSCGNLEPVALAMRERYPAARIVICADVGNGETAAAEAAKACGAVLARPDFGPERTDAQTDMNDLHAVRGLDAVRESIDAALNGPQSDAAAPDGTSGQPVAGNATAADSEAAAWPAAMDAAALHGIAGEFVRMIEPHTEADPAAILAQFLVAFGALVGRGPHYRVEGDQHHANLFALLVGATAKGRKGTSWGRVREAFELVTDWKPHVSGLSSGEGLKWNVRDMQEATKPNKKGELVTEIVDEGVTDKRLLVTESEFASALRSVQRQGNTLSATVREAWDTGNLRTLTKHDPITANGAHICIIGHVTADELRAELNATDTANGFANRFLFVAVKRSKLLPFGGARADEGEIQAFAIRLRELAALARTRGRLMMAADARAVWGAVYPQLSEGSGGLHGAVTARAEAQCIRLALVYALLDGAPEIDAPHLLAALAVWSYCDATARHVFGASLGDRIADEIMRRLRAAGDLGMTRTELRDAFGRHQSTERIGAALDMQRRKGEAQCSTEQTGGRPTETWRATKAT